MTRPFAPKHWRRLPVDSDATALLRSELGLDETIAALLVQRGVATPAEARAFLQPSMDDMHNPFLLPDAEIACERIKLALAGSEKIIIHGDYDGDGVTSAALWTRFLRALGADVDVFVPHRSRDGYDMRGSFIEKARAAGARLIITTDCGIQRVDEVELARASGIDVIVTDHHTPSSSGDLPKAAAVVNPHRRDSLYPFRDLAGVGVAFKLCEALTRYLGKPVESFRRGFMDLAAIGTITDVMPMLGENRILVKFGLEQLQNTRKPGLRALIAESGYAEKTLDTFAVGFGLGPRLNSASRIDETQLALDLLLTKDDAEAWKLARRLNELNSQRKTIQDGIYQEALAQAGSFDMADTRCIVLAGAGWNRSVVGIVASKIVDRLCRPCVVISLDEAAGTGHGSARSIEGFNLYNAIAECGELVQEFGGHALAAGLAIAPDDIQEFAERMNSIACRQLTEQDCVPSLEVAMDVKPEQISAQLLEQVARMAPFGNGNPEPHFASHSVRINEIKRMGAEKQHLKLVLDVEGLNPSNMVDAPWWNRGDLADVLEAGMCMDLCYRPQFNHFNGRRSIQFMLDDIRPADW